MGREGAQAGLFLCEKLQRFFPGLAVDTDIGDGVEPLPYAGVDGGKIGNIQAAQEILLYITDPVCRRMLSGFHPAFFVSLAHIAGGDAETVMAGEIQIFGVEDRRPADNPLEHRRLEVIDHYF